ASTQLVTSDPLALRLFELAGSVSTQGSSLGIGVLEALFNEMADVSQERPATPARWREIGQRCALSHAADGVDGRATGTRALRFVVVLHLCKPRQRTGLEKCRLPRD